MADRPGPAPVQTDEEIVAAVEKVPLPSRAGEPATNGAAFGIPTTVTMNVFKLHMERAPTKIYKYDLQFLATKRDGTAFELNNALMKVPDFLRLKKRHCLIACLRAAHESDKEYFRQQQIGDPDVNYWRSCCVFDCGNQYFTAVELKDHKGEIPEEVWKASGWIKCFVPVSCIGPIKWELRLTEVIPIDGENAKSQEARNFFTLLATQSLSRNEEIDVQRDAAFAMQGESTTDCKVLRKGIVAQSRTVGSDICVQMDSKLSLFFPATPLLDYIRNFSGKQDQTELANFLYNKQASSRLRKELQNLSLRSRHIATQRSFECKGLTDQSATDTTFTFKERVISIEEYFLERYKYRLRFAHLPMVLERTTKGNSYHPIECLDINQGVRVSNQKMSVQAQDAMIKQSCRPPEKLAQDLERSREIAQLNVLNKYLNAFEVKINDGFVNMPAKLLSKPFVSGMAGIRPEITETGSIGYTKGSSFKFVDPAKPEKPVVFLVVDNALDRASADQLKNSLLAGSAAFGMKITFDGPSESVMGGQLDCLREVFTVWMKKASMFFLVTPTKMDENHDMVKKLEQELGVVTQLIWKGTAQNILKEQKFTRFNIIAKMNQKLGGAVCNPEVPPELQRKDADAYKRALTDWFPNRMFIGLSLSHAGAQSYADRLVGEQVKEPSCVGMAFTLAQPGKRTALSWFIEKRRPIIDDLSRHFIRALDVYAESNKGKMPTSILVFRKGMSEGELQKAAYEMNQLKSAIKQLSVERKECKEYRPTIQCVVCMSNTSDRLFYQGGTENVPAGTVLEKEATNRNLTEFIIVAHKAIKGTAKPVRCTLVCDLKGKDGRRLSLPELQSIYHSLCYVHGIAASPTRLPVPLSDSEKAAERQMNNFKEALNSGFDVTLGGTMEEADYYPRLSDDFAHKFSINQYYA